MNETPRIEKDRTETIERIHHLKGSEVSYGIALALNHKYDFGGYSVGRSERSYLLDMFLRLNSKLNSGVADVDPFENGDLFIQEAKKRISEQYLGTKGEINESIAEDVSCVILRLWINHYRHEMAKLGDRGFKGTNIDYSYASESERAELLYKTYIQEQNVDEDVLDEKSQQFVDANQEGLMKYKMDLKWKVDDLCEEMN